MIVERSLEKIVAKRLGDNKAIILLGPRQVGKTTLAKKLAAQSERNTLFFNADESDVRIEFANANTAKLRQLVGKNNLVIIDEAQRIENIGLTIKIIVDNFPDIKVIATGSSAFELANKINEPLTGRKWEHLMLPFSFGEMVNATHFLQEKSMLEQRLLYGYYPDVVKNTIDAHAILKQLSNSYLYKDILVWERIMKPDKLELLVKALALQVGNQVSYHELGQICGLDNQTIEKYIDLLEKSFIVFRLHSFSRNIRNELKRSRKIYFYDNGLRNAVINQFAPISQRSDIGALWENFFVTERMKYLLYNEIDVSRYFWRTAAQQEIDFVEEANGILTAFECKWNEKAKVKFPKIFEETYPNSILQTVTPKNFDSFIM